MRFSLKTLLALICLAALAIGATTKLRSTSAKRSKEASLITAIAQNNRAMQQAIKRSEDLGFHRTQTALIAKTQQQTKLSQRLTQAFMDAAGKDQAEPAPERVTVRERLLIKLPHVYQKSWSIHVADDQNAALRLDFVDRNESKINVATEFVDQQQRRWPLIKGANEVVVVFRIENADFSIAINAQEVAKFECVNKEITGHSARNFTSGIQRYDFKSDIRAPLMLIWPSPGTTGVRIDIVKGTDE